MKNHLLSACNCVFLFKRFIVVNVDLENYYLKHPEPIQGCLFALKEIIMSVNDQITHEQKYQIPFFCYKGKKLGFLWMNRKKLILGFVTDKRVFSPQAGMKHKDGLEMIQINPEEDLPKDLIVAKFQELIGLYEEFESKK